MRRSTERLAPRQRTLLALAVALALAAGAALFGQSVGQGTPSTGTVDAAAQRNVPRGGAGAAQHAANGHQRAAGQQAADGQQQAADGQQQAANDQQQAASDQQAGTGQQQAGTGQQQAANGQQQAANGQRRGDHRGDHRRAQKQQNATANPNCTLVVPSAPTSAAGLSTPYQLVATDRGAGPCNEANADQSAFVEAAIFDPATHALSIYHPLVVDRGDRPAAPPAPATLPAGAVVGVWFGFNGDTLTLSGPGAGDCVNGLPGSPFGQFAYCNAPALFQAATADATFQKSIPPLSTGKDNLPCPTSRDFSVVDQDQSDNLVTAYRIIGGRIAQTTPATANRGTALTNGSDEGLVANFIAPALGCQPPTAPDLTNGGAPAPSLALNELFAAARQPAPAALVPTSDPMAQVDGETSTKKTNLYRAGVGQPALPTGQTAQEYCKDLQTVAPARLATDAPFLRAAPAPTPDTPDLLTFLQNRLQTTQQNLGCQPAAGGGAKG